MELSTGIPMLYIHKDAKFMRRGSPAGPTEAGVYAYSKVCIFSLALGFLQNVPFYSDNNHCIILI